jgi:aryl-alcohol dehydrogenase-like predicted oxidoreductase
MTSAQSSGFFTLGDKSVARMGFGAMRITGKGIWGEPSDPDTCKQVLHRALELGVTLIDTADSYGPDVSENLIAEALHPYPGDLVIATKGGLTRGGPNRWEPDCTPRHLKLACEGSLRRLQVDAIDVYQLHTVDRSVPYEESIGAIKELQDEGKVRHIGVSNVSVTNLTKARELVDVVSVQNRYSPANRADEDVLKDCERLGIGFLPWNPIDAGDLSASGPLDDVASQVGATPVQIALAWLLKRSKVMLPIPGTSSVTHLEENVAAAEIDLTEQQMTAVEDALA